VVLPTPNPPATRILADLIRPAVDCRIVGSEFAEST
jgi:hypothetical protein